MVEVATEERDQRYELSELISSDRPPERFFVGELYTKFKDSLVAKFWHFYRLISGLEDGAAGAQPSPAQPSPAASAQVLLKGPVRRIWPDFAGHRSWLAISGEGARVKERCDLKCHHLMLLFSLSISRMSTLNL